MAWAQPQFMPERSTTVASPQEGPAPQVHALLGVTTVILFDAEIDQTSVQVDRTRIKLVDVGPRSILFVPLLEIGPGERLGLTVRYADGATPAQAHFAIVSRAPTVDTVLSVLRNPQSLAACQAELAQVREGCAGTAAPVWHLVDRLQGREVKVQRLWNMAPTISGFELLRGHAYEFKAAMLMVLQMRSSPGQPPWLPRHAALTCESTRAPLKITQLSVRGGSAKADGVIEVAAETELPPPTMGLMFTLELRGTDGQTLSLPIDLSPAPPGDEASK